MGRIEKNICFSSDFRPHPPVETISRLVYRSFKCYPPVVDIVNDVVNSRLAAASKSVSNILSSAGVSQDVMMRVSNSFSEFKSPFSDFNNEYKINRKFQSHPKYVVPEELILGTKCVRRKKKDSLIDIEVNETYQNVSLLKTLNSLLQNHEYVSLLNFPPEGSEEQRKILKIQIFYDGLSTTNPLRRKTHRQTLGVFYFTILNLPSRFRSCHSNIHLLAICPYHLLNPIIATIIRDLKILKIQGISVNVHGFGETVFYGTLSNVSRDTLALNQILGLIESFSWDYWCLKFNHRHQDFVLRNIDSHTADFNSKAFDQVHFRGVKSFSPLLEVFDPFENPALDIMHILLEGIVPRVTEIIMSFLSTSGFFSLSFFTREILSVFECLLISRGNSPVKLTSFSFHGMTATQIWTTFRYIPVLFGDLISNDSMHWKLFLLLHEIVDIMFF